MKIFCLLYHVGILPGLGIRISPDGLDLSLFGFCTALWPFDHFASDQPCSKSLSTIVSDQPCSKSLSTMSLLSLFQNKLSLALSLFQQSFFCLSFKT